MPRERIYLDHNASSPLRPEAREAMLRVMDMPGNPSSIHAEGRALKGEIERARASVARLVGAEPEQVFFTSGATEAANWAMREEVRPAAAVEHPCVLAVAEGGRLDVRSDGRIVAQDVRAGMQLANSETGVVQSCRGGYLCDVVQAVGRIPVSIPDLDVEFLVLSGHKLGGPHGVGALVVRHPDALPKPLIRGGGQERNQRAGTENVVGIAGFGAAAETALRDLDDMPRIRAMRDRLEAGLQDLSAPQGARLHVFGAGAERLPNTSCFAVEGVEAQTALMSLDLDGFAVSSGSACSSGKVGRSHVLKAMGVADDVAACALRVSLGWTNTDDDIPAFLAAYERIVARIMRRAA